jgi:hypothetical protein
LIADCLAAHSAAWSNPEAFASAKYRFACCWKRVVKPRSLAVWFRRYAFVGARFACCAGVVGAAADVPVAASAATAATRATSDVRPMLASRLGVMAAEHSRTSDAM